MTLPYLYPLFTPRVVIFSSVLLMLTACSAQPLTSSDKAPVASDKVVGAPLIEASASSLIAPLVEASVSPLIAPSTFINEEVLLDDAGAEKRVLATIKPSQKPIDTIAVWLGEAGWAFEQDKLTTPKNQSAYYYLARVLAKDPNNPQALAALEKIVQRYYELLQSSLAQDRLAQARVYLSRAKKVIPKHRQLTAMRALIDGRAVQKQVAVMSVPENSMPETTMPAMRNQNLLLPATLVKQQDKMLAQWLVIVANKAQSLQATMLIVAPTDAQARWIYQTMNGADSDRRIRANIKHSKPARIEFSYLARKDELEVYPN
ncbi:MAG: hypothetical protein ACI9EP_000036 [Oceanospirillaceae bacterium]|jgi:hypothetical protein